MICGMHSLLRLLFLLLLLDCGAHSRCVCWMDDAFSRCEFDEVQVMLRRWIDTRSDAWVS